MTKGIRNTMSRKVVGMAGSAVIALAVTAGGVTNEVGLAERFANSRTNETAAAKGPQGTVLGDHPTNTVTEAEGKALSDPDVERLLRECGLNFGYCEDGDFWLTFKMENGRSQKVFVSSKLRELYGLKLRKAYAVAYRGQITKAMAMELLRENYKLGYWHIDEDETGNRDLVMFMAQIPWDITPAEFKVAVERVAEAADQKENEWSDSDDF